MNSKRRTDGRRHLSALEQFDERLVGDNSEWYAERLELLGRAMFGEPWTSREAAEEKRDTHE